MTAAVAAIGIAVVGAGPMGARHARAIAAHPGARLVAVVDRHDGRAAALARTHGVPWSTSPEALVGVASAVVVATGADGHVAVGAGLLAAGIDVLVEKPMADDDRGGALLLAAAGADRILQVGHIERFNSAVGPLAALRGRAVRVLATRIAVVAPGRATDVVSDLMIHDIDLALLLAGAHVRPEVLDAHGRRDPAGRLVHATATVALGAGCTATLTASWTGSTPQRRLVVNDGDHDTACDLLVRHDPSQPGADALARQLAAFLHSVQTREQPEVTGWEGLRAVQVASAIRSAVPGV